MSDRVRNEHWDRVAWTCAGIGSVWAGKALDPDIFQPFRNHAPHYLDDPGAEYERLMRSKQ